MSQSRSEAICTCCKESRSPSQQADRIVSQKSSRPLLRLEDTADTISMNSTRLSSAINSRKLRGHLQKRIGSRWPKEAAMERIEPLNSIRSRRKLRRKRDNLRHPFVRCSVNSGPILATKCSISLIAALLLPAALVGGQCLNGTMTSFERIGSVAIKDSMLQVLYTAPNMSAAYGGHHQGRPGYGLETMGGGLATQNTPITAECNNRCRRDSKCRAFLVDYARHTCYSVQQSVANLHSTSASGLVRTLPPIHLVPTQDRTSYFEKVCLNLPAIECERAWVYERVMGHHLYGYDDKIIDDVPSRLKCQEYCLNEAEFRCRSGEYDYLSMQCRLSMVDRHLKPNSFRPTANNVDYFENQCVPVGNQCDAFDQYEDMDLGRAEIMRSANTSDQCQQFCTQTIKAFICRSFTWNPILGKCYLNSANSFMVGGLDRLTRAPGLTYYQRNDCIDLKLECDTTAMTLNLRTNEPFRGRMYVRDDPNACETMGRSSLTSSLSIPFQSHARCAVREPPNRFSSVVVVQQHPMIQRKSDRYIKLVCDFQTSNKTITSSYTVNNNPWTSTALINATSFAPKIKLRITDKFGVDIAGAKLGDELYLRIEAETESVYDMVARSVLAKSGITDESIMLIDKDGCPTDFRIFPSLKKLNRRTIVGKFDAFKFSSDVVVRFQVDVQFCLNQCPSTSCDSNSNLLLLNSQLANDAFESAGAPITPNGQQQQQHQTTTSPMASNQPTNLAGSSQQHNSNNNNHDSSLVTAFSSTQAPVPFQPHTRTSSMLANQTPVPSMGVGAHLAANSALANSDMRGSSVKNYTSALANQQQQLDSPPDSYYYSPSSTSSTASSSAAGLHSSLGGRHPSVPANSPAANPPNFTSSNPSIMDLLTPASDPQIFEQSQPRSAPLQQSMADQAMKMASIEAAKGQQRMRQKEQQQQQQLTGNSIDAQTSVADGPISTTGDSTSGGGGGGGSTDHQVNGNKLRRRRRSAEPMPRTPSHVPLQREIIVESTQPSQQVGGFNRPMVQHMSQQPQHQNQHNHRGGKSNRRDAKRSDAAKADGLNRNGPAYDLNGNQNRQEEDQQQQQQHQSQADNGTLLCTTRHSLVIASMAFCTVQFFTIALCLVTWLHRRDTKFKVRHPVEQRLY